MTSLVECGLHLPSAGQQQRPGQRGEHDVFMLLCHAHLCLSASDKKMERICEEDFQDFGDSDLEADFITECTVDGGPSDAALGIEPYKFEPYLSDDDTDSHSSTSSESDLGEDATGIDHDLGRLQNVEW